MRKLKRAISICVVFVATTAWAQQPGAKPPPPSTHIPELKSVRPIVVCGNCDRPFDTGTHDKVLEGLTSNPYNAELRKALYLQDTLHQFESKAHFDNCDFSGATSYIDQLLGDIDGHVKKANEAKSRNDMSAVENSVKAAFFSLGQALHGAQDFYAHTNYVELAVKDAKSVNDVKFITPWNAAGRETISNLQNKGLISGFVFWGFPQKCPTGTPSHSALAKDKATTKSGAIKVPHLENRNHYQIAVQLARATSQALVDHAFAKWPLLKQVNGPTTAFEVLVDRRGL